MKELFHFEKCFLKSVSFPKSVFQSIYACPNRKNKSRKCFNIGLIRKNKSCKIKFFLLLSRKNKSRNNLSGTN